VIVPSALEGGARAPSDRQRPDRARVAANARELSRFRLSSSAGLGFALLTGDLNPVHWLRPYARALGFDGTILHGFATLARVVEALQAALFDGRSDRLKVIDVRFTRPLCLPAEVGLYLAGDELSVGTDRGEPAYLTGSFRER
jgi:acyl dehydratase